jgi:hypothetical protein
MTEIKISKVKRNMGVKPREMRHMLLVVLLVESPRCGKFFNTELLKCY